MKKLSDYKGEAAIELWADLISPITAIAADKKTKEVYDNGTYMDVIRYVLKEHKKEAMEICLRVDETPIDGINIVTRTFGIFTDVMNSPEAQSFFGSAQRANDLNALSGFATESTEEAGN